MVKKVQYKSKSIIHLEMEWIFTPKRSEYFYPRVSDAHVSDVEWQPSGKFCIMELIGMGSNQSRRRTPSDETNGTIIFTHYVRLIFH